MDIAATSILNQQIAQNQVQTAQTFLKNTAKQEQQTAAILTNAIESAAASGSQRGTLLNILA